MNMRNVRAELIAKKNVITQDGEGFVVPSLTSKRKYFVCQENDGWACGCADHHYRGVLCKHIQAVRLWQEMKKEILTYDAVAEEEAPVLGCPYCKGEDVVKNGSRKNALTVKQRYLCRACNKTFLTDAFKKFKGDGKVITAVLDLYLKGISLRKIQDHLKQFYGVNVHFETIRRWIVRYMGIINSYTKTQKPIVGKVWHTDEMMIKSNGKFLYLWNCMDAETRFMLANNVSKGREVRDAMAVFSRARTTTCEVPSQMITDRLGSYNTAFKKVFPSTGSEHVSIVHRRHEIDNNILERLNGTVRERDKVLRGLKGDKSATRFFENYTTYYNFLRPHQALDGRTPAQEAGIVAPVIQNKWIGMIMEAKKQS